LTDPTDSLGEFRFKQIQTYNPKEPAQRIIHSQVHCVCFYGCVQQCDTMNITES